MAARDGWPTIEGASSLWEMFHNRLDLVCVRLLSGMLQSGAIAMAYTRSWDQVNSID